MDTQTVITLGKDAITVVLTLSAPLMAVGLLVGLVIGIFQTVTSVQESTLAYIPKMVAVFLAFLVIDMVVSSVLTSMGMFMLPPVMISVPFKILLFVLVDGWNLVIKSLAAGFLGS